MVKTRFAPSPTGFLHIGGLRTALFAYLFAKKKAGKFLLRIEDTDRERYVEGGVDNILNSLYWCGIKIDEGVVFDHEKKIVQVGGEGPYIQSQKLKTYNKYVKQLVHDGHAYHCFCTKQRLEELRGKQEKEKKPVGYDGLCRNLSVDEVQRKIKQGEKYVIRMKMPEKGTTVFTDLVRDQVEFENNSIDDQILIKADGYPTYHLAVVVDDHQMGVTHVIRGEEWISSTPKHIMLYKMFDWKKPVYAHLPLLVNEQKQKLSKRHGDITVENFREKGYLAPALINFVAFLGWNPGDEREIFTLEQLSDEFSFKHVSKRSAVLNLDKLNWYNKQYLMMLPVEQIVERVIPFFLNTGILSEKEIKRDRTQELLAKAVELERTRVNTLQELASSLGFIFAHNLEYQPELLLWKKSTTEQTKNNLRSLYILLQNLDKEKWNEKELESTIKDMIQEKKLSNGEILWPMRVALSGEKNSPGPFEIAAVIGKDKTMDRIEKAINILR